MIFGFKTFLAEGGNVSIVDDAGNVVATAEKIDLKKLDRDEVVDEIKAVLIAFNKKFQKKFKRELWDEKMIEDGTIFAGSAKFFMDKSIPAAEFIKHKPTVGDVDVQCPEDEKENVDAVLVPGTEFGGHKYVGHGKSSPGGKQLNTLFEIDTELGKVNAQIDFEFLEFENGKPTEWTSFSHSASWDDIKQGFKGVAHKYLLRSLGQAFQKERVIFTRKTKKEREPEMTHDFAFSVDRGLRAKYEDAVDDMGKALISKGGKPGHFEIPSADLSNDDYDRDIESIMKKLFGLGPGQSPTSDDLNKFQSFVGLVDLMKKHFDKDQQKKVVEGFAELCWGKGGQQLERDNPEADNEIKTTAVDYLLTKLGLTSLKSKFGKMKKEFYDNYKSLADRIKSAADKKAKAAEKVKK